MLLAMPLLLAAALRVAERGSLRGLPGHISFLARITLTESFGLGAVPGALVVAACILWAWRRRTPWAFLAATLIAVAASWLFLAYAGYYGFATR